MELMETQKETDGAMLETKTVFWTGGDFNSYWSNMSSHFIVTKLDSLSLSE